MKLRRFQGWTGALLGSLLLLALWGLVTVIAARPAFKALWDLTPQQTASVSPTTATLIEGLRSREGGGRIEIHTFFERVGVHARMSDQDRALASIYNNLHSLTLDLLRQYSALGGDRLRVVHNDPYADPDATRANKDRFKVRKRNVLAIGFVAEGAAGTEVLRTRELSLVQDLAEIDTGSEMPIPGAGQRLPSLARFNGEEQISSAIKTLLAGGTPRLYLLTGHREKTDTRTGVEYTGLVANLEEEGFEIASFSLASGAVPEDASVIACIDPTVEFSQSESEALIAYLRRGGRMFLNLSYVETPASWTVRLRDFLAPLGLDVGTDMVAQWWENQPAHLAQTLRLTRINPAHPITRPLVVGQIDAPLMKAARPIMKASQPALEVGVDTSLLMTDPMCWLAPRLPSGGPDLRPPGAGGFRSFSVGATVDVPPEVEGGRHGKLVLISGVTFENRALLSGAHRDLALNCFEWLAERRELVTVRRNAMESTTIDFGSDPEAQARRLGWTRLFLTLGVPLFFLILGLIVGWRRRRI